MIIDCDSCIVRDIDCDDCVVSFLTRPGHRPAAAHEIGEDEQLALVALADGGLVPPLRLRQADTG